MICFPNAKINIGLYVTEKRPDGYHNLETVFLPVPLYDALEVIPATDSITSLKIYGLDITGELTNNLVWKAWEIIAASFPDKISPVHIYLNKAIPMGAGMGGGSADGTFMLLLLNKYFQLDIPQEQLAAFALQLGSDCPFFLYNTPQLGYGRGEVLQAVNLDVDWNKYKICFVHPNVHISTRDAFSKITPHIPGFNMKNIGALPVESWKEHISNNFEKSIFHYYPQLKNIKTYLYNKGAAYVSMTGTGSAFYGIFAKESLRGVKTNDWLYPVKWCDDITIKN